MDDIKHAKKHLKFVGYGPKILDPKSKELKNLTDPIEILDQTILVETSGYQDRNEQIKLSTEAGSLLDLQRRLLYESTMTPTDPNAPPTPYNEIFDIRADEFTIRDAYTRSKNNLQEQTKVFARHLQEKREREAREIDRQKSLLVEESLKQNRPQSSSPNSPGT